MDAPQLSVVIPVYNEEAGLPALFARLYPALDALGVRYEVIFVNDGSRDRSAALLREQWARRPDTTRVVLFNANYGQHLAIVAGFERCRGDRVVTLDADLQNPPEEIGRLLEAMDAGHDYVGGVRRKREDRWWRRAASRAVNRVREKITRIQMTDHGCMLRAYSREIVEAIARSREISTFIPALALATYVGESVYRLFECDYAGADSRDATAVFWDRDILAFFLVGMVLFGLGLVGEYVGRIYQQVRARPRYTVRAVLESSADGAAPAEAPAPTPAAPESAHR